MPKIRGTLAEKKLREAKQWTAFCKRRDELRANFLAAGNTKTDASAAATVKALQEFKINEIEPPVEKEKEPEPLVPQEEDDGPEDPEWAQNHVPMRKAVEWVFSAIGRSEVKKCDSPGPGAWALLKWVRETDSKGHRFNVSEFYRTFAAKLLPTRTQIDVEGDRADDGTGIAASTIAKIFGPDSLLSGDPADAERELALEDPDECDGEEGPEDSE